MGERYFGFGSHCAQVNFKNFATACRRRQPAGHWIKIYTENVAATADWLSLSCHLSVVYRPVQKNLHFPCAITYALKVGAWLALLWDYVHAAGQFIILCMVDLILSHLSEIINSFFSVATFAFSRHSFAPFLLRWPNFKNHKSHVPSDGKFSRHIALCRTSIKCHCNARINLLQIMWFSLVVMQGAIFNVTFPRKGDHQSWGNASPSCHQLILV